jgi:hypothetical protein
MALVIVALGVRGPAAQSPKQETMWHFSAEDEGSYPSTEIPAVVLQLISRDEGVRNLLDAQNPSQREVPRAWLSASKVHLAGRDENNVVIQGIGPILGANVTTFWVFRDNGDKAALLLEVIAHDLIIRQPRTKGYLTIDAVSATASFVTTDSFQMKNGKYAKWREKTEKLP